MTMTLEEKIKILSIVAYRFASRSNNRYEINELVNEAWLRKNVRESESESYLYTASRSAMIDYMRVEGKIQFRRRYRDFYIHSLTNKDGGIRDIEITSPDLIATIDYLEYCIKGLQPMHQLIAKHYLAGNGMRQIGKMFNLSESRISQIWNAIKAIMRIKHKIWINDVTN